MNDMNMLTAGSSVGHTKKNAPVNRPATNVGALNCGFTLIFIQL